MTKDIVTIEQLPIITERLKEFSNEIELVTKDALQMECTEDTVKLVKKQRSALNNYFNELEQKRKDVKKAVFKPYEQFEDVYKDLVTKPYKEANTTLVRRIAEVEDELKKRKKNEVVLYYAEYASSKKVLDFAPFERADININLTISLKKLKEQAKAFIDHICDDLALIETQENKAEILVEYKLSLNCSLAITTVAARIEAIEKQKQQEELKKEQLEKEKQVTQKVEEVLDAPLISPVMAEPVVETPVMQAASTAVSADEQIKTLKFSVTASIGQLKLLKNFLLMGGYYCE